MSKPLKVDLCVIGAGSGGLSVAAGAVQLGFDVALIEKSEMGGDCLNTGCVPSKSMLAAAHAAQGFRTADRFGIAPQEPQVDFSAVKDHVNSVIARIEPHDSQERFEGLGIKVFREQAAFTGTHSLKTGDQVIEAKYFVIAAGARAAIPPIDGLDPAKALTNENIFSLRERPEHLIIIGGGPIGVEMAQAHRRLGCTVSLLDLGPILPKDDPEMVAVIRHALEQDGISLFESIKVKKVEHSENGVSVFIEQDGGEKEIKGLHILIAAGRTPNTDTLALEKAGVTYNKKGIEVDARLRTNQKHIYAIGDIVAGGPQFTHAAGYQAGIVIKNMMFKIPAMVDYSALPWVTYTDPELAHVGLTEAQARGKHGEDVHIIKWQLKENDRAMAEKNTDGMIKVVTRRNGKILGASIAAQHAGELIPLWTLALSKGMKVRALANMIMPYPTLSEISKRAAGAFYTPKLFSDRTRTLVHWLQKLPF